ncbi:MAG: acetoin utilization protein AcuC [Nitrososphaerales archaeon]|nr:acetoin utilization protein AcuC [Nitrososphaerales archaeon]
MTDGKRTMLANRDCRLTVAYGPESELYSFPESHPLNNSRANLFAESLGRLASLGTAASSGRLRVVKPTPAKAEDLLLFHTPEYVQLVREASKVGKGHLDYGDTPAFKGVFEASLFPVGSSLKGLKLLLDGECNHFFNPIGGLHHARSGSAGGFCVFNDAAIVIHKALAEGKFSRVAYIDIDAHHGDGVFYAFESDPRVVVGDIHEDGRFLYPGTGSATETGRGEARGTKLNIPIPPGSGDTEFFVALARIVEFVRGFRPEFIFFQCGADGLAGDPITHLRYSSAAHAYAAKKLHSMAHEFCEGRILAMGGGGYDPENVSAAWSTVVRELMGADE